MKKNIIKLKQINKWIIRTYNKIKQKIYLTKISLKCYIRTRYMLTIDTKKNALLYVIIILIGLLLSYCLNIKYNIEMDDATEYYELFRNTGIALLGLSGIVFTLQIFSQESQNNYMNSVMEKIIDIRAQHIVEYSYLSLTTIAFLLLPKICIDINIRINYYYISMITILILLGIDLFSTTRNSNKYRLIKRIEKRVNRIVDLVDKDNKDFELYCTKYN